LREAANHEESCVHIMGGKKIEQPWRPRGIWTVIECQRKLVWPWRRGERSSENLRTRRHGGVGAASHGEPNRANCAESHANSSS
jgi:hypothetical protein